MSVQQQVELDALRKDLATAQELLVSHDAMLTEVLRLLHELNEKLTNDRR